MTGSVDKGDSGVPKLQNRLMRKDSDSPLPLKRVGVKKCVTLIHSAKASGCATAVKKTFGEGGFTCINVGENANGYIFHISLSFLSLKFR